MKLPQQTADATCATNLLPGAFKIQSHLMYFDTEHNSTRTVLATLHGAFAETATKMWAYIRCMPQSKRPRSSLVIRTLHHPGRVAV